MGYLNKVMLLSLSLVYPCLQAQTTTYPYPPSPRYEGQYAPGPQARATTQPSAEADRVDQEKMAAWMIESSQAAQEFVDTIDKGQYSQSWNKGDQLFQHTITQPEWTQYLNIARKNMGRVTSRNVSLQKPSWNPRGLPKGPYMVIVYDTSFENKPKSIEILTLRLGSDGVWRVLTYNVKQ